MSEPAAYQEAEGNDELRSIGAFSRKTKIGKHRATNVHHLRETIQALDAAGHSDAADTLVWQVWHRVNSVARAREFHALTITDKAEVERDYGLLCQEERRLRERLEDKGNSLRVEIAAKVVAYRDIATLEAGIREIIGICEQDARDQDHNGKSEGWGKGAKAYAEGRGMACRGIAARLRALLPADPA